MRRLAAFGGLALAVPLAMIAALIWILFATQPPTGSPEFGASGPCGSSSTTVHRAVDGALPGLDREQSRNARVIMQVGVDMKIPIKGLVVALVAASQESGIRNLHYGDQDSQGLFQMRPSAGWGTVAQVTDPTYAAHKFYTVLRGVSGWDLLAPGAAAQAIERSGYPYAYTQWEPRAWQVARRYLREPSRGVREPQRVSAGTLAPPGVSVASVGHGAVLVDGQRLSAIAARQLRLAERLSGIHLTVMQGGYGGHHIAASGISHNYSGVADISPGTIAVEQWLRRVGFAAWARNIAGRSSVGSGAHVHAVSLLDPGDARSAQVYGSWAHHGNGLAGTDNDPAPRPAWLPNLRGRVGGVSLVRPVDIADCAA